MVNIIALITLTFFTPTTGLKVDSINLDLNERGAYVIGKSNYFLIECFLTNNSKGTKEFLMMNCSAYDNFILESKLLLMR